MSMRGYVAIDQIYHHSIIVCTASTDIVLSADYNRPVTLLYAIDIHIDRRS
jgi:hypothetical protein